MYHFRCRFGRAIVVYHGKCDAVKKNRTFYVVTETDFFGMSSGATAKRFLATAFLGMTKEGREKDSSVTAFLGMIRKRDKTRLSDSLRGCFSQPLRNNYLSIYSAQKRCRIAATSQREALFCG